MDHVHTSGPCLPEHGSKYHAYQCFYKDFFNAFFNNVVFSGFNFLAIQMDEMGQGQSKLYSPNGGRKYTKCV